MQALKTEKADRITSRLTGNIALEKNNNMIYNRCGIIPHRFYFKRLLSPWASSDEEAVRRTEGEMILRKTVKLDVV